MSRPHRHLPVLRRPLEPAESLGPVVADMLTVMNRSADAGIAATLTIAKQQGMSTPCKRGCAACCQVPVTSTIAEVWIIVKELRTWTVPRQASVRSRLDEALGLARRKRIDLHQVGLARGCLSPDRVEAGRLAALERVRPPSNHSFRYAEARISCPFLEVGGDCGIYTARPMRCRGYYSVELDAGPCQMPGAMVMRLMTHEVEARAHEHAIERLAQTLGGSSAAVRGAAGRHLPLIAVPVNLLLLLGPAWTAVKDASVTFERFLAHVGPIARRAERDLADAGMSPLQARL